MKLFHPPVGDFYFKFSKPNSSSDSIRNFYEFRNQEASRSIGFMQCIIMYPFVREWQPNEKSDQKVKSLQWARKLAFQISRGCSKGNTSTYYNTLRCQQVVNRILWRSGKLLITFLVMEIFLMVTHFEGGLLCLFWSRFCQTLENLSCAMTSSETSCFANIFALFPAWFWYSL